MFYLTKQERQVILFLTAIALIGIGINFLAKRYSCAKVIGYFSQDIDKIDLNKADKEMLMGVSGIGERLAQRIIEYRVKGGGFSEVSQLKEVKGITDYRYEKLKDLFCVR